MHFSGEDYVNDEIVTAMFFLLSATIRGSPKHLMNRSP